MRPAVGRRSRVNCSTTRRHQEEVEKTLNDLLTRLEPWSSTREVKGEANKLLEEQRKLNAELEELTKKEKDLLGKPREELTEKQRTELEELHDAQQRLQERTQQLLEKMERLGQERAQKDPDGAKELQNARDQAGKERYCRPDEAGEGRCEAEPHSGSAKRIRKA